MTLQRTSRIPKLTAASVLVLVLFAVSIPASARTPAQKKQLARQQLDAAEEMRQKFLATADSQRTRRDYQRVTEAFRRVYYLSPTFARADEAATNVGDLLAAMGRTFSDPKLSQAAIKQYEFLRREYPGSKFRVDALYAIGKIYKEDLADTKEARASFEEFLKRYPHSHRVAQTRSDLAELDQPSRKAKKSPLVSVRDSVLGPTKAETKPIVAEDTKSPKPTPVVDSKDEPPAAVNPAATEDKSQRKSTLPLVTGIRHWSTPDYTRVAIDLETEVKYEAGRIANPERIFFDLHDTKLPSALMGKTFDVEDGFLRKIRVAQFQRGMTRVVLDVDNISDYSAFLLPNPYRLIIDIHGKKAPRALANGTQQKQAPVAAAQPASTSAVTVQQKPTVTAKAAAETPEPRNGALSGSTREKAEAVSKKVGNKGEQVPVVAAKLDQPEVKSTTEPTSSPTYESVAPRDEILPKIRRGKRQPARESIHEARPTSNGERSLTRALGLKIGRIVIDAGHGGHDAGTVGPNGLQEKDLVLDVALRLGKMLQSKMGADVVYTRSDDTFIPLETRTAIANKEQADLFISIHANSSRDPAARGVETYYLRTTSSPDALEVAARENAVSEKSIHELQDLVKKITLNDKIDESREFAADVQRALYTGVSAKSPTIRNRGVKKAPFIVLIGANMPSILAEISFLSNPTDEKRLLTPDYRQKIAEYLYKGIDRYIDGLSGLKVASRTERTEITTKTAKVADDADR